MLKKRSITICITILIALLCTATLTLPVAASQTPIRVLLDGNPLQFDVQPNTVDGRTMVPMRVIFEALGAEVQWNEATSTITATRGDLVIQMTIGDRNMRVNGVSRTMDTAPISIAGRTLVPVRFISEAFGCEVRWDANTRIVHINTTAGTTRTERYVSDDGWVYIYSYDANDQWISEASYAPDGVLEWRYEYEYNARGWMTKVTGYDRFGVSGWTIYEYDANGNNTKSTWYNANGTISGWNERVFNSNGYTTRSSSFDAAGKLEWRTDYEYNALGYTTRHTDYNDQGLVGWGINEFDSRDRFIRYTYFNADGTIDYWNEVEYDNQDRVIRETYYSGDGTIQGWYVYRHDGDNWYSWQGYYNANGELEWQWPED